MGEALLLCAVIVVPTILALDFLDRAAGSVTHLRSREHSLASSGVFFDHPIGMPRQSRIADPGIERSTAASAGAPRPDTAPALPADGAAEAIT